MLYAVAMSMTAGTGAVLGRDDWAGLLALWNFYGMATFAIVPTWLAGWHGWHKRKAEHRRWAVRSFAVCYSVSTLLRFAFLWAMPLLGRQQSTVAQQKWLQYAA